MQDRLLDAAPVLQRLHDAGFEAYYVGGCVRDSILGRAVNDVDIASSAMPDEVMALFPRHVPTGLKHGTVTVLVNGIPYEVTTFREESAYEAHRRPAEVAFIRELSGDLLRRDFTINAMAMRIDGTLIDPFGGMPDMKQGIIRCVGDADARFQEDALRMLRGIRFAAAFGYRFAYGTWKALLRHRALLRHIAMERVGTELDKMVGGPDPARGVAIVNRARLWGLTKVPLRLTQELQQQASDGPACADLRQLNGVRSVNNRWSAIGLASGTEQRAAMEWMGSFGLGHKRLKAIEAVIELHRQLAATEKAKLRSAWTRQILAHGREAAADAIALGREGALLTPAAGIDWDRLEQWLDAMTVFNVQELAVRGDEIVAISKRKPGAWIRLLLEELLYAAASGEIANERDPLLAEALLRLREQEEL
jgi:tRNA nucleotidyltransferase (CCA-adding enzyme)